MPTGPARAPATAETGAAFSHGWLLAILLASVGYLSVLSLLNARGLTVSPMRVGMVEALIFAACLGLQLRRLPLATVAVGVFILSWLVFTWLVRQRIDLKGVRDLVIAVLFLSLGRYVADVGFARRCLMGITAVLVAVALFEAVFTDAFAALFNTFSFYANIGGIQEGAAMYGGQMLTLNGYRPDGIGRTLLPSVLGNHRVSSLLMEPVSLGNFAVVLMAWVLSQPWAAIRRDALLLLASVLLIVLCDSRFGLLMAAGLLAWRCLPMPMFAALPALVPALGLGALLAVASWFPSGGDNLMGRLTRSGLELLHFDAAMWLGLGNAPAFGDMGYAYVLSRFGLPLVLGLLLALFVLPMASARAVRFRALIVLYFFASLAISGTSVFALKTAGLMWFLFGVLSAAVPRPVAALADAPSRPTGPAARGLGRAPLSPLRPACE